MKPEEQIRNYFSEENLFDRWGPLVSFGAALVGLYPLFNPDTYRAVSPSSYLWGHALLLVVPLVGTVAWHAAATNRLLGKDAERTAFPKDLKYAFPNAWIAAILGFVVPNFLLLGLVLLKSESWSDPLLFVASALFVQMSYGFWFLLPNALASAVLYISHKFRSSSSLSLRAPRLNNSSLSLRTQHLSSVAALGFGLSLLSIAAFLIMRTHLDWARLRPLVANEYPRLVVSGIGMVLGMLGILRSQTRLWRKSRWIQDAQSGLVPGIRVEERIDEGTGRVEHVAVEVETEDDGAYRTGETHQELLRWEEPAPHK